MGWKWLKVTIVVGTKAYWEIEASTGHVQNIYSYLDYSLLIPTKRTPEIQILHIYEMYRHATTPVIIFNGY